MLFIVVGFLVFVLENWKRQRYTLYLNTSHRAIAFEATSPTNLLILECWPEDLPTLRAKWDRVEWVDGRDPHRVRRKGQFLGIWHAHKVRGLIQETLRSRLHERFRSGDPAVRRAAIISAAESSGPDWMPLELLQAAESCDDPLVRLVATQALMRLRQTTAEASPEPAGDLRSK